MSGFKKKKGLNLMVVKIRTPVGYKDPECPSQHCGAIQSVPPNPWCRRRKPLITSTDVIRILSSGHHECTKF